MTIKITGLEFKPVSSKGKVEGTLNLELSVNGIKANSTYNIEDISWQRRKDLSDILEEIEYEMNGGKVLEPFNYRDSNVGSDNTDSCSTKEMDLSGRPIYKIKNSSTYGSGGTIGIKENLAKIHTREKVLNKDETDKLLETTLDFDKQKWEEAKQLNTFIADKFKKALEQINDVLEVSSIPSYETDTNKEVDAVSDALDKAVDVFNIVFNINEETKKSAQDLVKDMANEMKNRGKWQ